MHHSDYKADHKLNNISGKTITLQASTLSLNGAHKVTMGTGAEVDIQAALIKLN